MPEKTKKPVSYLLILTTIGLLVGGFHFQTPKAREAANLRIQRFSDLGLNFALADTAATSATVGNAFPGVTNVSLNAGANITLVENTIKGVDVTGQISDDNKCADMTGVTAMVYVTSLDTSCSADDNSCYVSISCNTSDCDTSAGSTQTSADVTCSASLWFHSNPETWETSILVTDGSSATAEGESASAVTVLTLNALGVTSSIAYGSVSAGSTTASNQSANVTATGNAAIDCSLQGTDMVSAAPGTIKAPKQKYGLTDVAYGSLTSSLSTSDDAVELECAKPTQNSPVQAGAIDIVYWGLGVDAGTPTGTDYSGYNTFTVTSD